VRTGSFGPRVAGDDIHATLPAIPAIALKVADLLEVTEEELLASTAS